jgi:hypothetical protein
MRGQKCVSHLDGNNKWNTVTSKIKERKCSVPTHVGLCEMWIGLVKPTIQSLTLIKVN